MEFSRSSASVNFTRKTILIPNILYGIMSKLTSSIQSFFINTGTDKLHSLKLGEFKNMYVCTYMPWYVRLINGEIEIVTNQIN